ncbi:MAG: T9SS type A sorting domain-containing protein [Bacteroidetes bacterium]|nr:T9SS type A sorting domain-containing protein [Bacteroidota bacterium]MCW5897160.1 T9SS type A sorting domain-containing protein [Bacteroidota bacterium]
MKQLYTLLFILCLVLPSAVWGEKPQKSRSTPGSTFNQLGLPHYSLLNINNITTWMRRDGQSNHAPTGAEGVYYPRGTRWVVYQDGFVWGGKAYLDADYTIPHPTQVIRIGGATYNVGTQAGRVIGFGPDAVPANPNDPEVRIFRIRRDYAQMSQDELRRDASEYFEVPFADVTPFQISSISTQYQIDWMEWPVEYGAPYIERNGQPGYQPPPPFSPNFTVDSLIPGYYDEPGLAGVNTSFPADQVIWTVFNDLNRAISTSFYGSEPLGLEAQVTIWGYKRTDALGQTYFKRIRFINKGGVDRGGGVMGSLYIDSMYIAQWSDPDLGNFADDLAGCDTVVKMGYVYNGHALDAQFAQLNLPPPAFGYSIAQGPIVPGMPGDTGIYNFRRWQGRRNLSMTSFAYFASGNPYVDPPPSYNGALQWWKLLRGFLPNWQLDLHYPHPPGEPVSFFPLNGDPVHGTGFIDGAGTTYSYILGDRRIIVNTGPFRLAPGDTQEVIMANTGGIGADRLSSISAMKAHARVAKSSVQHLLGSKPPLATSAVTYPNPTEATVRLHADARGIPAQSITATLLTPSGTIIGSFPLYDDGTHGDTLAGDGRWTNELTISRQQQGLSAQLTVSETGSGSFVWEGILTQITTLGPLSFSNLRVFADNTNNDGRANPGEIVRFGFSTVNQAAGELSGLRVTPLSEFDGKTRTIPLLPAGSTDSMTYNPSEPSSFFSVKIPPDYPDSLFSIQIQMEDANFNRWTGRIGMMVYPYGFQLPRAALNHITGQASGSPEVVIVNPAAIQNHLYLIRGVDSLNGEVARFMLKDSTSGSILINRSPLPDTTGFNIPVTDGFRIRLGTLETRGGIRGWDVPNGTLRFSSIGGEWTSFEGFGGTIDWYDPSYFFGIAPAKGLHARELRNVIIKLATAASGSGSNLNTGFPYGGWNRETTTDPNMSYAYRYLRAATAAPALPEFAPYIVNPSAGYAYQDYKKGVPFSAWDIDANPPRRLAVGFHENNVSAGLVDGLYWPPPANTVVGNNQVREFFFIFGRDYTGDTPDPALMVDALNNSLPVMWWGTVTRADNTNFFTGDEFLILARKVMTSADTWTFNPTIVLGIDGDSRPEEFALFQNYPNPFNPTTTIRYQLPVPSLVTIKIYNILGQEISTLVEEVRTHGTHTAMWNGTNRAGNNVATGVYFYRMEAKPTSGKAGTFMRVQKMLLLK